MEADARKVGGIFVEGPIAIEKLYFLHRFDRQNCPNSHHLHKYNPKRGFSIGFAMSLFHYSITTSVIFSILGLQPLLEIAFVHV